MSYCLPYRLNSTYGCLQGILYGHYNGRVLCINLRGSLRMPCSITNYLTFFIYYTYYPQHNMYLLGSISTYKIWKKYLHKLYVWYWYIGRLYSLVKLQSKFGTCAFNVEIQLLIEVQSTFSVWVLAEVTQKWTLLYKAQVLLSSL